MKKHIITIGKTQVSAFLGGLVDWALLIFLTDYCHVFYTFSIIIAGFVGAVINFTINRYWSFKATNEQKRIQASKFFVMVLGSIFFKTTGTTLLTQNTILNYKISKLLMDFIVSFGFNFPLQKFWIFRK